MFKKLTKSLKKAFTITELVIVIAVIAILAAVLIPTFSNVISSANQSAALSTCKNALTDLEGVAANEGDTSEDLYGTGFSSNDYYYVFFMGQLYYLGEIDTSSSIDDIGDNVAEVGVVLSDEAGLSISKESTTSGVTTSNITTYVDLSATGAAKFTYGSTTYTETASTTDTNTVVIVYTLVINSTYYLGMFTIEVGTSQYTPKCQLEGATYSSSGSIVQIDASKLTTVSTGGGGVTLL